MATWFGYNAPFYNPGGKPLQRQEDARLIKNDLLQLLLTVPGERYNAPDFGVNLRNYTFEMIDEIGLTLLRDEIASKIALYEQRVTVKNIDISGEPDKNFMTIKIFGSLNTLQNIDFNAELNIPLVTTVTAAPQQLR
jgi:phage baseplate assembly protein W